MKKLYSLILSVVMAVTLCGTMAVNVKADEATLTEMSVEAQANSGDRTEVKLTPEFSADVTEYEATVANDTIKLVISATTTEEDAEYEVDWEALDVGDNKTYVYVTAADGTKTTYTIYTKRLTEEEEATYEADENEDSEDEDSEDADSENADSEGTDSETSGITVNGTEMKISSDFDETDVPEGFAEAEYEYQGKTYTVIKGEKKSLIAMWLKPVSSDSADDGEEGSDENTEETSDQTAEEGFYVYDETAGTFYDMDNLYVKSRMYTVIQNPEPDAYLDDYESVEIEIIDETVEAWVLDEQNSLYLVYAMNWEGETSLYCYDDIEKCLQRYIIDSAAANLLDEANVKINNSENKARELVKKYNDSNSTKYKIIAVLAILVVILFFVAINLWFALKSKQLGDDDDNDDDDYRKPSRKERKESKYGNERERRARYYNDEDDDDEDDELFKLVEDDDFLIVNDTRSSQAEAPKQDDDFNLGEIDMSSQIINEMENAARTQAPVIDNTPVVEERTSFKAQKDEPFNEDALQSILSTAFPREEEPEEDDDGFTFI